MSGTEEQIMEMVELALREDSSLTSAQLRAKAIEIDESVEALSGRQFHARYTIQVRRRLGVKSEAGSKGRVDLGPVHRLLYDGFAAKKADLIDAVDAAFERSLRSGRVAELDRLLVVLDRHAAELRNA